MSFVQSKSVDGGSSSHATQAITFTSNVTAGHLIVLSVWYDRASTGGGAITVTATDNLGGGSTYLQAGAGTFNATNNIGLVILFAIAAASGACTITAHFSGNVTFPLLAAHEASGFPNGAALDAVSYNQQSAPGTGANAITSGAATTTRNGDYIFGCAIPNLTNPVVTAGTGYTIRETGTADTFTEDQTQSTAGSIAATFTQGTNPSNEWLTGMAAFTSTVAARVSQVAVEVLQKVPAAVTNVALSQVAVEVLRPPPITRQVIWVGLPP